MLPKASKTKCKRDWIISETGKKKNEPSPHLHLSSNIVGGEMVMKKFQQSYLLHVSPLELMISQWLLFFI